jgi:PiT family inorganic phosphate transporter
MATPPSPERHRGEPPLDKKPGLFTIGVCRTGHGLVFTAYSLMHDMHELGTVVTTWTPFLLLGVALLIALGLNSSMAFTTPPTPWPVIYTNSLPPQFAVVWSGFQFPRGAAVQWRGGVRHHRPAAGRADSAGRSSAGFAMIFALLIAAILWNLGTWWLGLPASSSHTLIGSIIGVGVANALMHGRDGTSGVEEQAIKIGYALLLSPLIGFLLPPLLLLALRAFVKNRALYKNRKATRRHLGGFAAC